MIQAKKNTLVSGNAGDEKNLHIYIFKLIFQRYSLFFFSFFCIFCILVFLLVCFVKLKTYILIQNRLCWCVSDKKIFTWSISRNKTTFVVGLTNDSRNEVVSQNIFNNLHMILHSWNSAIKEVVFTLEAMYIYRVSCPRLYFSNL